MVVVFVYGLEKNFSGEKNVLIFDFGGGIFDVFVLIIDEGLFFEVQVIVGNIYFGGEDFDNCFVEYFVEEFKCKFKKDFKGNLRVLCCLKIVCE